MGVILLVLLIALTDSAMRLAGSCAKDLMMKTTARDFMQLIRMPVATHEFYSAHGTLITSEYGCHQWLIDSIFSYHSY